MFYVRHGQDDQTRMFNANCQVAVMISHLKYALKMPANSIIDLLPYPAPGQHTLPVGLNERPADLYCDQFLQLRGTYILLQAKMAAETAADELATPATIGAGGLGATSAAGGGVASSGGERGGSAGASGSIASNTGVISTVPSSREWLLAWDCPSDPDEKDRIGIMLTRPADPKKQQPKKGGGKK